MDHHPRLRIIERMGKGKRKRKPENSSGFRYSQYVKNTLTRLLLNL